MLRMDIVTERRNRTMNTADKIKELVQTLNRHRHAYYNLNTPEISDAEYDRMYDQLKKLEEEQQNLTRVSDILSELTRQLAPLERQSETARV